VLARSAQALAQSKDLCNSAELHRSFKAFSA